MSRRLLRPALLLCALLTLAGGLEVFAANETRFLEIWKRHELLPDKHDDIVALCGKFAEENPGDGLLEAVRSIEAWHHLAAGRQAEAWAIFESQCGLGSASVPSAASHVANGWLSRRDRENVEQALKAHYNQQISYPKSLGEITAHQPPPTKSPFPATDSFGAPWDYKLTGKIPGFENQNYSLSSTHLGERSVLSSSLTLPYAAHLTAAPLAVLPGPGGESMVRFQDSETKAMATLAEGKSTAQFHLAHVGNRIVVVCDATHWKVFPKP